ncbi:hypothetical protein UY3_16929 [Chelonia mydas]|uniref:Uncharacterized protein n=1 Tax=Chelonia mydas TaxID=8469 RepID=M7B1H8_CHEMY|nr:hypothetical protein UY3_16929 [Chelonia mydas]
MECCCEEAGEPLTSQGDTTMIMYWHVKRPYHQFGFRCAWTKHSALHSLGTNVNDLHKVQGTGEPRPFYEYERKRHAPLLGKSRMHRKRHDGEVI